MARVGPQKRRKLTKVLRENGLAEFKKKGKGSHTWWEHPDDPARATTVPDSETIKEGTANAIIEQAGKTVDEYLSHRH